MYYVYMQLYIYMYHSFSSLPFPALGLAVARDGSSGGVLRLAIIAESGVTRTVYTGSEIPQFYSE